VAPTQLRASFIGATGVCNMQGGCIIVQDEGRETLDEQRARGFGERLE